jgi:serine phosphatase RsbU (regulator of sigma subunit)
MSGVPESATLVTWGVASVSLEQGTECGDLHVIASFKDGTLVAAIDGLGHGVEAALAAREAARILEAHAGESVLDLVQQCHEELRKTRGVVMSVASFDRRQSSVTWIGVGNVEGVLLRAKGADLTDEAIMCRGGVVGYQLPTLRAVALPVSPGDTLIMSTDGIRNGFTQGLDLEQTPEDTAQSILSRYAKGSDDALVLVARYIGDAR